MPKTWFITGASRGLGIELVHAVVRAGDQVIAGARDPKALTDQLRRYNDRILPVELDVTDAAAARAAVDTALSRFGAIDFLVNNAGYGTASAKLKSASVREVERILADCKPVGYTGTVARYLEARGIPLEQILLPRSLYEHPALAYYENGKKIGEYPAMVAEVRSPEGELVCLHRTYLDPSGHGKAPVAEPKKLTRVPGAGATIGAAIRLYETTDHVALTEGIESALIVTYAWCWPVWACISAQGLGSVELPPSITAVRICGDNDEAGVRAGREAERRLLSEGRDVELLIPVIRGQDPLDAMKRKSK
jgi:hypothetical protein